MNRKWSGQNLAIMVLLGLAMLVPCFRSASQETAQKFLIVSIPNLHTKTKERVVGFEIHVASGRIASFPDIPVGWNMTINNDASWDAEVRASSTVGAAALAPSCFHEFLIVERDESLKRPFKIWGDIVVTEDFAVERHVTVETKDFSLKKTGTRSSTCK